MTYRPHRRLASAAATADIAQSISSEIRTQRAMHLQERSHQQAIAAAREDVDAARRALEKIRDVSAETAALDAAVRRLASLESEVTS
jgi:hypothetical protein